MDDFKYNDYRFCDGVVIDFGRVIDYNDGNGHFVNIWIV